MILGITRPNSTLLSTERKVCPHEWNFAGIAVRVSSPYPPSPRVEEVQLLGCSWTPLQKHITPARYQLKYAALGPTIEGIYQKVSNSYFSELYWQLSLLEQKDQQGKCSRCLNLLYTDCQHNLQQVI